MPRKAALLQLSRKVHLYFGLLISPALLFFAFTGAVQTLGYHEPSANYKPIALLASLGQIHKKQTYVVPVRRGPGPTEPTRPDAAGQPGATPVAGGTPHRRHDPDAPQDQDRTPAGAPSRDGAVPPARTPDLATEQNSSRQGAGPLQARTDPSPAAQARPGGGQPPLTLQAKQKQHLPLKLFFVLVSVGLFTSTLTGIYMAYKYDRNTLLVTALLVVGLVLPLILLRF